MFLTAGLGELYAETAPETAAEQNTVERDTVEQNSVELALIDAGFEGPWPEGRPEDFDLALRELHEKASDAQFVLTADDFATYEECPGILIFKLKAKAGERLRSKVPPDTAFPDLEIEGWLSGKAFLLTLNDKAVQGGIAYFRNAAAIFPYPTLKLTQLNPIELSIRSWDEDRARQSRFDLKSPLADHGVQIEECRPPQ